MKLQCPCGAKYTFDVTPEMASKPIRFVCSACGLDSSDFVNSLIRQELAASTDCAGSNVPAAPAQPLSGLAAPTKTSAIKVSLPANTRPATLRIERPEPVVNEVAPESDQMSHCPKHPGEVATE